MNTFQSETKNVYALAPYYQLWTNQHLLKDCGIIPYLLHKKYGYNATMVGWKNGEFPYLETYLQGLKMEYLPACQTYTQSIKELVRYVGENYEKMDILVLYGTYITYHPAINLYRKLRPDGRVYDAIDGISHWMDRIHWTDESFTCFFNQCDVLATSGKSIQRALSQKWPRWKIEYIPNGFFNVTGKPISVNLEQKEKILLTVGRIGTDQKANHILLEAFAAVSAQIEDWAVHLVGEIDEGFESYIATYFEKNPHLKARVVFTGLLESKDELYKEYSKAKIFILTSTYEGGTPNVFAEALQHGCYMITSQIDASEDITHNGECGKSFPVGNVSALQQVLLEVCNDDEMIENGIQNALNYASYNYNWDLIIEKLHYLLIGSEEARND